MNYPSKEEAAALICEIGRRMYQRAYVAANDGNISCRVGEDSVWITPSGVSKGYMTEDMLLRVDLEGHVLEGSRKPSSEMKMHLRVYLENPAVRAVVHAHPLAATSFAIARVPLDTAVLTEAEYATPGTQGVPDSVAPFCRDYNAVLLANHGALTWGLDVLEAYYRMETLECYAAILMNLGYLNRPAHVLDRAQTRELVDIRRRMGVEAGGVPRCAEDLADET